MRVDRSPGQSSNIPLQRSRRGGRLDRTWGIPIYLMLLCTGLSCAVFPTPALADADQQAFQHLSDETLLEQAIQRYRETGDCDEPIRLYHALLSRHPTGRLQLAALFNQGKCFEQRRFWAEALANYQQLVEQFPQAPAQLDARFRQGVVLEQLGRHAEAAHHFEQVKRAGTGLTEADLRALEIQLAWQALMQGQTQHALRRLRPVQTAWAQLSEEDRRPERFYQAKAELALGLALSRYAASAGLVPETHAQKLGLWLARRLGKEQDWFQQRFGRWETRMQAARSHYEAAVELGLNPWVAAGYYGLGTDGLRFLQAIRQAPVPEALAEDERQRYRAEVKARTHEYLQASAQLFVQGHEQALGRADRSAWAQLLAELAQLLEQEGVEGIETLDPGWPWLRNGLQGAGGTEAELIRPLR